MGEGTFSSHLYHSSSAIGCIPTWEYLVFENYREILNVLSENVNVFRYVDANNTNHFSLMNFIYAKISRVHVFKWWISPCGKGFFPVTTVYYNQNTASKSAHFVSINVLCYLPSRSTLGSNINNKKITGLCCQTSKVAHHS